MRVLKTDEDQKVKEKLKTFVGDNIKELLEKYELRLNNQRVFLVTKELLKASSQLGRDDIISCGVILGKITKTGNFKITITSLHTLHRYGIYKVWIKLSAEMNYLYGNNTLKSHIQKLSESIPMNATVFVFNQNQIPLGFGIMALSPSSYEKARGGDSVVLTQADNGEYIRSETSLA